MKWFIVGLLFAIASEASPQAKHDPTVAQCRADQALWLSKLESELGRSGVTKMAFNTLDDWGTEMRRCKSIDPRNTLAYENTDYDTVSEQYGRFMSFIVRQGLLKQFLDEDAKGLR